MESIINQSGNNNFIRVRIGIGRPVNPDYEVSDWVLGRFIQEEEMLVRNALERAGDAIAIIVDHSPEVAMNRFN